MARSKHRKNHKQALTHWKAIHCTPAPRPPRVVKPLPQRETPKRMATVTALTPEGWEAELEGGGTLKITGAAGAAPQKGDRFLIDYPLGGVNRSGDVIRVEGLPKPPGPIEEAFVDKPLRGPTHYITHLEDDAIFGLGADLHLRAAHMLGADYADLEKRALAQLLKENPGKTLEELLSKPQALSMGCVVEDPKRPEDPGRGLAEHVYGPGAQAHLELENMRASGEFQEIVDQEISDWVALSGVEIPE